VDARELVLRHWEAANARDWAAFAALLADDLLYEVPQTGERVRGAAGYLDFFRTWPGDWRAEPVRVIAQDDTVVTVIDFRTPDGVETGIGIFAVADGRITRVTDYWPAPYDPPPRLSAFVEKT
jgi:ketosteroid isomerase-like protein